MESQRIESLLEKYEDGITTLQEEQTLQEFFTSKNVPAHLKEYEVLFSYTAKAKTNAYPKPVMVPARKKKFAFIGAAASIVIAMGIFVAVNNPREEIANQNLGTIEDPEEAYYKAKETLQLLSAALNTGREELTYVAEFEKAKNKYIKE